MSRLSATRGVGIRCGRYNRLDDGRRQVARPPLEDGQARRRCPERSGDQDGVARPGPAAAERRAGHAPDEGDREDDAAGRRAGVAPDERHAVLLGHVQEPGVELVDVRHGEVRGQREGQQRQPGLPAHGGDVGDVDRDRLGADVAKRGGGPAEVDALEQGVRRQEERLPAPGHRGRVIPDADQDVGPGRRQPAAEPGDEPPLAELRQRGAGRPRVRVLAGPHRPAPLRRPRPSAS